jgi:NAD(P)-dependent dehydrogenase (short-subunit alcohol dehydrogenase family)
VKAFGHLDGIIINHGALLPLERIADANIEEWKRVYDINVFSAIALAKEARPLLRKTQGRIIFTSSGAALGGYVSWCAYGSSKAAMNSLARHLAVEEPSIATIAVGPGRVDTDMQKDLRDAGKGVMADADYATFVKDFDEGQLNRPELPAQVIADLSIAAPLELSGKYLKYAKCHRPLLALPS